jgi:hypothetical protein
MDIQGAVIGAADCLSDPARQMNVRGRNDDRIALIEDFHNAIERMILFFLGFLMSR